MSFGFKLKKFFNSYRIIFLGFLGVIITGSLLLLLPISSADGKPKNYIDCLFTSISCVCVTGLVTLNTATTWSLFGQFVLLLLIQTGGLGVITVTMIFSVALGKRIGLSGRSIMQDSVSALEIKGIVKFAKFIVFGVLIFEAAGAVAMMPVFIRDFGALKGIWYSVFHSVSAFCNAGFDLLGYETPFVSLTAYKANPVINIAIMLLIFIGGLGFLTWADVKKHRFRFKKYRTQSKIILVSSLALVFVPAIYFFIFEFGDLPLGERVLTSLFQSVTPRTAGFNTADLTKMSDTGIAIMTGLMLVGGAPGSTAGGMKITTFAVLIITSMSVFRRRGEASAFKRRIAEETIKQAVAVFFLYIVFFLIGGMSIATIEKLPLLTCLFESASAIATVGLTLGITPSLCVASKIILMLMMFFGRIGVLTLVYATTSGIKYDERHPIDKISIG